LLQTLIVDLTSSSSESLVTVLASQAFVTPTIILPGGGATSNPKSFITAAIEAGGKLFIVDEYARSRGSQTLLVAFTTSSSEFLVTALSSQAFYILMVIFPGIAASHLKCFIDVTIEAGVKFFYWGWVCRRQYEQP
jgi:hypothetical protein